MMLAHVLLAVLTTAAPPDSLLTADSLLVEMRKGGYTMLWRHTATDQSVREPMGYDNLPRFQQRNLTDRGIADARAVGALFKRRDIPIGEVLSSPMFRTRETAEYAFGRVDATPLLRQLEPSPEQRRVIATEPAAGTNRVLVTHHFIIERNVPGIDPGMIAEGEAAVVRATRAGIRLVGIIKMADWQRLGSQATNEAAATGASRDLAPSAHGTGGVVAHGGAGMARPVTGASSGASTPLVIPAVLETPDRLAVAEYFRTFNAGDAARMRRFYEHAVVPNADRTIDQRMEVYDRLRTDLGALSIVSVETVEPARVVVRVRSSAGPAGTITFEQEPQAPRRLTRITFQLGG